MTEILAGKVAIVTGARRGIGAAEARALAAAGSTVVICDLVYEDLLTVKADIDDAGGSCMALKCDVSDKSQVVHVVDETISAYGKVDVLINNAQGAMDPTEWENITDDMVMTALMTGPVASYWFMQACFPHMKTQGRGRIINTSSAASRGGIANLGHYAMAKGAIASLTYAAATDWGQFGITVNVLFPGIESESLTQYLADKPELRARFEASIPLQRFGNPSADLAPVVVFIASDASQYLTGHPFFIDGGAAQAPR